MLTRPAFAKSLPRLASTLSLPPIIRPINVRQRMSRIDFHSANNLGAGHAVGEMVAQIPHVDGKLYDRGRPVIERDRQLRGHHHRPAVREVDAAYSVGTARH